MSKRHVVALALVAGLLIGGLVALAPVSFAQPDAPGSQAPGKEVAPPHQDAGSVLPIDSLQGLTCEIDCIEEPDITVSGDDLTIEDCYDICESHCGGPCGPA